MKKSHPETSPKQKMFAQTVGIEPIGYPERLSPIPLAQLFESLLSVSRPHQQCLA